jgi:hypothetical protein
LWKGFKKERTGQFHRIVRDLRAMVEKNAGVREEKKNVNTVVGKRKLHF